MGQWWSNPIQYREQLLEHAKKTGNKKGEAKAYNDLGKAYVLNKQFEKAKKCFNNSLKIAKQQKDEMQESNAYRGLASANASTNEFEIAMEYANKALEVDLISQCNEKWSKYLDEFEIEKLSTSNTNKRWSRIIGEPDNKQSSHTSDSADLQNTQHETPNRAYKHLEKAFAVLTKHKKTINDYKNILGIPPGPEENNLEISAYLWLGHSLLLIGQHKESLECYNEVIKRATQFKDKKMEMSGYLGLGSAFSNMEDSESSIKYFLKALTMAEEYGDNNLKRETHIKLGNVCYTAGKFNEALKSYRKAQKISADLGARTDENNPYFMQAQEISGGQDKKKDDANIWFMLGNTFQQLKQETKAIESFEKAMVIGNELKDKEMVVIVTERLGLSYLTFASVCRKGRDYERAIELYQKALHIFGTNYPHYHFLREKALTGLGVALFRLGKTAKAIQSIQEAQKLAVKDGDTGNKKSATNQKSSLAQIPAELLNSIEETCNLASTEWLPTGDLASLEKHIEEFSASNIYTVPASGKVPLTKIDRITMTENVKSLARKDLLNPHEANGGKNDEKFVDLSSDEKIYNLAREDVSKNVSTKIPARLLKNLTLYMKSIGQISCGEARGTCFLVADMLAMTNHHVFRAFMEERFKQQKPDLPITVTFDYLQPEQKRNLVMVEVDEGRDPEYDSGSLDYTFFHLKENEGLRGRVPLGPIVRCRPLQEGVLIIMGHPVGSELLEETCVVVSSHSWREKLGQRRDKLAHSVGVHMTNDDLLRDLSSEEYQDRVPYDTTLFSGASGSPVFDVNGNIVAMHAQGYKLDLEGGKCSLMEFGVQFSAIYEDLRRRNVDVKKLFPNYNEEEDMDVDENIY